MNAKNDFGLLWMSAMGHYTAGGANGGDKEEGPLLPRNYLSSNNVSRVLSLIYCPTRILAPGCMLYHSDKLNLQGGGCIIHPHEPNILARTLIFFTINHLPPKALPHRYHRRQEAVWLITAEFITAE
jgi:hypothetical protein